MTLNQHRQENTLNMPNSYTVPLGKRSYDIVIDENLIQQAGTLIAPLLPMKRVILVTDSNIAALHLEKLQQSLTDQAISFHTVILPAGEQTKSFAKLEALLEEILKTKPERKITLIAFGGGVIGDITGFAASILLRGVPFIQIPTTLLSQVDSSVGGKTGINSKMGKNLIGSFYQPKQVLADLSLLHTLSEREYKAGYAEIVKYGIIGDKKFFHWLDQHTDHINQRDITILRESVECSCKAKATIVAQDERESGIRALLNLGHTFGHALEAECAYDGSLVHGEAVSVGMVLAMQYSHKIGVCSKAACEAVIHHLHAVELPTTLSDIRPNWEAANLLQHMYQDKKLENGQLVLILTRDIGDAYIAKEIDGASVQQFLQEIIDGTFSYNE